MTYKRKEDYIVVKTYQEAEDLVMNYKGKSLAGKPVIVALNGLRFVSEQDIRQLPQVKSLLKKERAGLIKKMKINIAPYITENDWKEVVKSLK